MQYTQKYQKREKKMKDFESLKTSTKNKVLTVVFNKPEKMNTFSGQMLKDILELLDEAEKDGFINEESVLEDSSANGDEEVPSEDTEESSDAEQTQSKE